MALTIPLVGFELPFEVIALGLIAGITYALFGVGLSLTYQNSRVLNFAQGGMGVLPHLLLASLVIDHHWSYWPALGAALVAALASGALLQSLVIRRLARAPRLVVLVATIGAAQLLTAPVAYIVNVSRSGLAQAQYPTPFHATVTIGSLRLFAGHLMILGVAPFLILGLTIFMRRTTTGLASRAMAENDEAAQLSGIPVQRISLAIWTIAGLLAGTAAILAGPTKPVLTGGLGAATVGGDLLLRGLGAAMIGGLVSLPQIFGAGLALGVIESLVRWNYPASNSLEVVMMVAIVGSLLLRTDLRRLARGDEESSWSLAGAIRTLPERVRRDPRVKAARMIGMALLLGVVALLPVGASPSRMVLYSAIVIYALIGVSLVVLVGWGGQVSLGHFAFVALGALVGGRLHELGYSRFGALVGAVLVGTLVSALVGIPALRIRGLFLAVTTLAFAVAVDSWLQRQHWLVHITSASSSTRIPRPSVGSVEFLSERNFYYLVVVLLVVVATGVHHLRGTGIARSIMAVRDNEPMAASLSISPTVAKISTFMLSGAIASFAGYFYGALLTNFRYVGLTNPGLSLDLVVMVIFGGATSITGAILGALYVRGLPYFVTSQWTQLLSSGLGLLLVLLFVPGGIASLAFRLRDAVVRRLVGDIDDEAPDAPAAPTIPLVAAAPRQVTADGEAVGPALEARDVMVRYGGLMAVGGVSIHAMPGEMIGLIGPNGAGKTTLFDVLSGLVAPTSGQVLLDGVDVTAFAPEQRATLGLARSFQQANLFGDLTVLDVLKVALERVERSETVPSLLALPPSRQAEQRKEDRARELVAFLGLEPFAHKRAMELSTGTRRVVEMGCIVAMGANTLLLDEPTGGIAQREVEAFTPLLRDLHDRLGATTVIVAHDIPMMRNLVDRVYVLAAGQVIAEGPPDQVMEDPLVIETYLGADELGHDEDDVVLTGTEDTHV